MLFFFLSSFLDKKPVDCVLPHHGNQTTKKILVLYILIFYWSFATFCQWSCSLFHGACLLSGRAHWKKILNTGTLSTSSTLNRSALFHLQQICFLAHSWIPLPFNIVKWASGSPTCFWPFPWMLGFLSWHNILLLFWLSLKSWYQVVVSLSGSETLAQTFSWWSTGRHVPVSKLTVSEFPGC